MNTNSPFRLKHLILLSTFAFAFNVYSQEYLNFSVDYQKVYHQNYIKGTVLMENDSLQYNEPLVDTALKALLTCYSFDTNDCNLCCKIAQLYLMTSMHKDMALFYARKSVKRVMESPNNPYASPVAYYVLARAEHIYYMFDSAISNFNKFQEYANPKDAKRLKDLNYWIACCNNGKTMMQNPVNCKIVQLGDSFNCTYENYGPVLPADESGIYFTSLRPTTENTREAVWMASATGKGWGSPQDPGVPINNPGGNTSAVAISPDGQTMFFYHSNNIHNGMVYESNLVGTEWSKPMLLDSNNPGLINDQNSSSFSVSACISPDNNTLYFSSDRAGGQGGLDIYKTEKDSTGHWMKPVNLGNQINTEYDEEAPFVSADGSLLFFSSKGHNTMGGYDVFMSKFDTGMWGPPENLGYPVNTPDDDKFFVLSPDGKRAWYNTVRLGYSCKKNIYEVQFANASPVSPVTVLVGYVKTRDHSPLPPDTKVTIVSNYGTSSVTRPVNEATGKYIQLVKPSKNYDIVVTANGKKTNAYNFTPPAGSSYSLLGHAFYLDTIYIGDTAWNQYNKNYATVTPGNNNAAPTAANNNAAPAATDNGVTMLPLTKGNKIELHNIFFDFDKATLIGSSYIVLQQMVDMMNQHPTITVKISGYTDSVGSVKYNLALSRARARAVVNYLVAHGISSTRLSSEGYGKTNYESTNATDEGRALNRRTEFQITHE